jgi:guanine nucleotide-binding protein subunit alpha
MVIKEIRITHSGGFQDGERRGIRALIHSNVIIAFKVLLKIMQGENMQLEDERAKVYTDLIAPTGPNMVDGVAFTGKGIEPSVDFAHSLHNTLAHSVPL